MKKSKNGKPGTLGKNDYFDELEPLQLELNDLARWLMHTGKRLMVVIEGRDTAGKGGVISAIAETLSPRQCRNTGQFFRAWPDQRPLPRPWRSSRRRRRRQRDSAHQSSGS